MNEILTHFHFIRPLWLLAFIPSVLLVLYLLRSYQRSSQWQSLIDAKLLPFLVEGKFSKAQKIPLFGLGLIWLLLIIALAGPTWEEKPQPVQQDTSALVILWDLSPSMYAQDIKPSRLVRSRLKLVDLLDARKEGLTALIAYAGDSHVVTPLTDDTKTIKSLLPGLAPDVMPKAGSNPEQALEQAITLLKETGVAKGNIVFVTDGIVHNAIKRLGTISNAGKHSITVWGIGTQQGAPISLPDGGFVKNKKGEIVVAKVRHDVLSDAAVAMKGTYIPFSNDGSDITSILHFGFDNYEGNTNKKIDGDTRKMDSWLDQGYWLVLFALPFAALAFRRGWLLCFAFGMFFQPAPAQAFGWQDLWKTKNQQAQELLQNEQAEEAAATFTDPQWQAIANYKAGDYDAAESQFSQQSDARAQYNLGNTLTHKGEYDAAIAAYNAALQAQPNFPEAEHNRSIAEQLKALESQQQSEQNNDQQDQGEQQDGDQQQGDSQQQNDQQQGENDQQQSQDAQSQNQPSEQSDGDQQSGEPSDNSEEEKQAEQQRAAKEDAEKEEAKQQALDKHYQDENENNAEKSEQEIAQAQEKPAEEGSEGEPQPAQAMQMQMTPEQKEQQQALDQWLRRVPDDPSGLLRNKFQYEHNKRQRENYDRTLRNPDGREPEERW